MMQMSPKGQSHSFATEQILPLGCPLRVDSEVIPQSSEMIAAGPNLAVNAPTAGLLILPTSVRELIFCQLLPRGIRIPRNNG